METTNKRESEFNDAWTKIDRLNNIRVQLHMSRRLKDKDDNLQLLYSFRSELDHRLTKDEKRLADHHEINIKQSLSGKKIVNPITGKVTRVKKDVFQALFLYELFLADRAEHYGLGMPDKKSFLDGLRD